MFRRPEPHEIGSVLPWAATATVGDPVLLLAPWALLGMLVVTVIGLGVPAHPRYLIPLVALPPVDAYHDVSIARAAFGSGAAAWATIVALLGVRALAWGSLFALAVQRARGLPPDLAEAARTVAVRFRPLLAIQGASFAVFGVALAFESRVPEAFDPGPARTALLLGTLIVPTALIASVADGLGPFASARRAVRWARRRPLGHLAVTLLAFVAANAVHRVAVAGDGRPPVYATVLLAFAAAIVAMAFALALARRYVLLYGDAQPGSRDEPREDERAGGSAPDPEDGS